MKIDHLVNENEIEEAIPFTKQWRKERQATKSVKADIGDLTSELLVFMRGSGIPGGQLSLDDFKSFLQQKGLNADVDAQLQQDRSASGRDPNEPLSKAEVKTLLTKAVQSGFKSMGMSSKKSRFAQPSAGGGSGSGGGLPPNLVSALSGLTPAQRAQLKSML